MERHDAHPVGRRHVDPGLPLEQQPPDGLVIEERGQSEGTEPVLRHRGGEGGLALLQVATGPGCASSIAPIFPT
jgi:hypothetical protein